MICHFFRGILIELKNRNFFQPSLHNISTKGKRILR